MKDGVCLHGHFERNDVLLTGATHLYRILHALPVPSLLPDLCLTRQDFSQLVYWF